MSQAASRGPRRNFALLRQLWPFIRPHLALAVAGLAFLALSTAASLALPVVLRYVIDKGFGTIHAEVINQVFIAMFALALVLALASAARYFCVTLLSERTMAGLRAALYDHVIRLDVDFFERNRVGELISRLGSDTEVLQVLIGTRVSVAVSSAVMMFASIAMMVWTSPRLTAVAAAVIPVMQFSIMGFGKRVQKQSRASQDRLADAAAIVNETLNAAPTVKAFTREAIESIRYADAVRRALATARRRVAMRALLTAIIIALLFGAITLMLWVGARDVLAHRLDPGELGQFVLYAFFASNSVSSLTEIWGDVLRAAGAMERIGELFAERTQIKDPPLPQALSRPIRGALSFERVGFHYPTRPDAPAVQDFSLDVRPGETVALVGPSGAGKSTIMALLLRFHDPQHGCIRLDGMDLRAISLAELRGAIAVVPQETVIFAASAAGNIRFGRQDAADDHVHRAAREAEADEFIRALSDGYDAELGERGVRLSGGQRQRIAIARAILRDAPLLLLDEATSALDAQSESAIQRALGRLARGRTTLVIAHRLSTIQRADRIVVMDRGRIVAQGTHEALMAEGGLYTELAQLQFLA